MLYSDYDLKEWKREQLEYYRTYQQGFSRGSREYSELKERLEKLKDLI